MSNYAADIKSFSESLGAIFGQWRFKARHAKSVGFASGFTAPLTICALRLKVTPLEQIRKDNKADLTEFNPVFGFTA
ncbi:hypothetical protein FB480_103218 [Agrobacterium vitis]|nr:hypothetical protein FB480_103218 [Agrobacterium vitis]